MNFIKRIFRNKNNTSRNALSNVDEIKFLPDEEVKIIVPESVIIDRNTPIIEDRHNIFNIVDRDNKTELYFRLMSNSSKEIMRINCTGYTYEFEDLRLLMAPEAMKNKLFNHTIPYVKEEEHWHYIVRLYITMKDRFFYQFIRNNGTCGYEQVDRKWVQSIIQKCESENNDKIFYKNENEKYYYVSKPGTYTIENFNRNVCKLNNIELIDSYEIVNKKLYDSIIEVF